MKAQLVCCEDTILREIAMPEMTPRDVAMTYRLAMESSEADKIDWGKINAAIMERWSKTMLIRIKTDAHSGKCFSA
jgi:hypothetical protein